MAKLIKTGLFAIYCASQICIFFLGACLFFTLLEFIPIWFESALGMLVTWLILSFCSNIYVLIMRFFDDRDIYDITLANFAVLVLGFALGPRSLFIIFVCGVAEVFMLFWFIARLIKPFINLETLKQRSGD